MCVLHVFRYDIGVGYEIQGPKFEAYTNDSSTGLEQQIEIVGGEFFSI